MRTHYRTLILGVLALAATGVVVAAAPPAGGQSAGHHTVMTDSAAPIRFMGVAVRATPPTEPFEIMLSRWSTTAERAQVLAAFGRAKTPGAFSKQLGTLPAIGSLRTVSGLGDAIYFAQRVKQPNAMDRLLLVTDPLYYWTPESDPNNVQPNYSVVQIQLTPAGTGKGWVTYDGQHVQLDEQGQTLVLNDLRDLGAQMLDVKPLGQGEKGLAFASAAAPRPGAPSAAGTSSAMGRTARTTHE